MLYRLRMQARSALSGLNRQWERFDADTREDKVYPSAALFGAASRAVSEQQKLIAELEARYADMVNLMGITNNRLALIQERLHANDVQGALEKVQTAQSAIAKQLESERG